VQPAGVDEAAGLLVITELITGLELDSPPIGLMT
jgi:hypothetical protein